MNKILYWSDETTVDRDFVLRATEIFAHLDGKELLKTFLCDVSPGRIALVSSFGAEAAILLHMAAEIDKATPVIFIDTQKLFPETLSYCNDLVTVLGLTNVKTLQPAPLRIAQEDPHGNLWQFNPDQCCQLRKTEPLEKALEPFSGWITGRKRIHGGLRQNLPLIELSNGKIKLNPLANWTMTDISTYFKENKLPIHPLYDQGYLSIGCMHCTVKTQNHDDPRSGRWAGTEKTECGIHLKNGKQ